MTTVFQILNPATGEKSSGGMWPYAVKGGKFWRTLAHVKAHITQLRNDIAAGEKPWYKDAVVVEYELVEKRRIPVREFLGAEAR